MRARCPASAARRPPCEYVVELAVEVPGTARTTLADVPLMPEGHEQT